MCEQRYFANKPRNACTRVTIIIYSFDISIYFSFDLYPCFFIFIPAASLNIQPVAFFISVYKKWLREFIDKKSDIVYTKKSG